MITLKIKKIFTWIGFSGSLNMMTLMTTYPLDDTLKYHV